ncbi:MAG TPA: family 10 glycosylhydrolase [Candidatus Sphingobacterium stercoripullorum]|uniref:Family 10 glycosylhydrolase n=1 Tax=Candidatus Sphingobacterium stercoripullorum TaxID=2838759 RepID=A0A9D1WBM8_9SPHI|nr:family 10 glycosylhydrolase [Candidatus Sphingobacterium stercoripullorum]
MRKNLTSSWSWIIAVCLFIASCSKDNGGITPDPDPKEPIGDELNFPKKEFRAVWISTAWGLDWPLGEYDLTKQKDLYIEYLDRFEELNLNAVFFQVKPMGDSFYESSYEPWSASITGTRGQAPSEDILKFLIDETHARGIEFHAWMNPYRIATRASSSTAYPPLHPSVSSDWVVSHEKIQIYNPAIPEVRKRLSDIVKELVQSYAVDGIHFDDYFYPDPSSAGVMVSDQEDYQTYGASYNTIEDFRRGNVDKTIELVYQTIKQVKPEVVFSVSPAPNNSYNVNTLFADVSKWAKERWIDVVIPQLYQEIGNQYNDFVTNLKWWIDNSGETPVIAGHGFYKFGDSQQPAAFQNAEELKKQVDLSRQSKKVVGNVQYSAKYLLEDKVGATTMLRNLNKEKTIIPFLGRQVDAEPITPKDVRVESGVLKWTSSYADRYVIYFFKDKSSIGQVIDVKAEPTLSSLDKGFYCITSLNKDNFESDYSELIEVK